MVNVNVGNVVGDAPLLVMLMFISFGGPSVVMAMVPGADADRLADAGEIVFSSSGSSGSSASVVTVPGAEPAAVPFVGVLPVLCVVPGCEVCPDSAVALVLVAGAAPIVVAGLSEVTTPLAVTTTTAAAEAATPSHVEALRVTTAPFVAAAAAARYPVVPVPSTMGRDQTRATRR